MKKYMIIYENDLHQYISSPQLFVYILVIIKWSHTLIQIFVCSYQYKYVSLHPVQESICDRSGYMINNHFSCDQRLLEAGNSLSLWAISYFGMEVPDIRNSKVVTIICSNSGVNTQISVHFDLCTYRSDKLSSRMILWKIHCLPYLY